MIDAVRPQGSAQVIDVRHPQQGKLCVPAASHGNRSHREEVCLGRARTRVGWSTPCCGAEHQRRAELRVARERWIAVYKVYSKEYYVKFI